MIKNILLATDLGTNSDRAMERALKISNEHKAKLHIIYVAPPYPRSKQKEASSQKVTEDLVCGYLRDYKDFGEVKTEIIVKQEGEICFEILKEAFARKVDLIVMGMHSKEGFRDLFIGTTIERVVRKGTKPVLMVKEKPVGSYQSVMSAIDFAPGSQTAMRIGMGLAPEAVFSAAHVHDVPIIGIPVHSADSYVHEYVRKAAKKNALKKMGAFLETESSHFSKEHKGKEMKLSGELMEGIVYDTLMDKAENLKADLITIGTHGKSGIFSKLGGTAGDILSSPPCDVLVATEQVCE